MSLYVPPTHSRILLTYCLFLAFVLLAFGYGIAVRFTGFTSGLKRTPDFDHYVFSKTLPDHHIPVSNTYNTEEGSNKRVIAIGDIHGMNESLHSLLQAASYDPRHDTMIHLGDLAIRAEVANSLAVLSFMSTNRIFGVRGNNDQTIIRWRAWTEWIAKQSGGRRWLDTVDAKLFPITEDPTFRFKHWMMHEKSNQKWIKKIPKDWNWSTKHFEVARAMTKEHYKYLASLPLVLYAPAGHTYFVHAGLLAYDITHKPSHPDQPLSHIPSLPRSQSSNNVALLRQMQETALLTDIPQNRDPWVLTNMRSITDNGVITKSNKKGSPWAKLWNNVMGKCSGFGAFDSQQQQLANADSNALDDDINGLQCYPSTVVYGHAAARGLDIKRWSVGLDTGCVYNNTLTALVLDWRSFESSTLEHTFTKEDPKRSTFAYGDHGQAHTISVDCS